MRIVHLLPGLDVGGVERHVVDLASEQARSGHHVTVVSGGGRMTSELHPGVTHIKLPIHVKEPFTGGVCALRLAIMARSRKWDILHAHSRVPAWVAWWTSVMSGVPFVVTCHAIYSLNAGLIPYRHADGAICVSQAVKDHQIDWLPRRSTVIRNGIVDPGVRWAPHDDKGPFRFLFIGRLTSVKGIDFLIDVLLSMTDRDDWILDVAGEGPLEVQLKERTTSARLGDRINFLGYRDDVVDLMARCDCCLFPSRSEGAGLVLLTALTMGVPLIASDLPAFKENLPPNAMVPLNKERWSEALGAVLDGKAVFSEIRRNFSLSDMAEEIEGLYLEVRKRKEVESS